jgi:hypothetical protein
VQKSCPGAYARRQVDSVTVYWNASNRFSDDSELGFGAETGISTDKLRARRPMALEELTSYNTSSEATDRSNLSRHVEIAFYSRNSWDDAQRTSQ